MNTIEGNLVAPKGMKVGIIASRFNEIIVNKLLGLIAAGLLDNPVKYAHIVTSTTHKTLRGPRGGIILMGKDFENPWGLTTPKGEVKMMSQILNSAGCKAVGTSSHVIANMLGYEDGENIPFKIMLMVITRIAEKAKILVSADLEAGYSNNYNEIVLNIECSL